MRRCLPAVLVALVLVSNLALVHAQEATPAASPAVYPAAGAAQDAATFAGNPGPREVPGALCSGFPDVHHTVAAVVATGDLVIRSTTPPVTHVCTQGWQCLAPRALPASCALW